MIDPRTVPIRFSHLKAMSRSPLHYRHGFDSDRDMAAMRKGCFVHALVLGGAERFTVYEGTRRGKDWEAFKLATVEREKDVRDVVSPAEWHLAKQCAAAVQAHPTAAELLEGHREIELNWHHGRRACQAHLDVLGARWVTDLKTTTIAAPGWFARQAVRMAYHAQLAWYLDAARDRGHLAEVAYVVAVETAAPFAIATFELTTRAVEEGRKLCRAWLERLLVCEESNEWPGYGEVTHELDVPEAEAVTLTIDGEELDVA